MIELGANLLGNALNAYGATAGARSASRDINRGIEENKRFSEQMSQEQRALQAPWMKGGQQAFGDMQSFRMREANPYQAGSFGGVNLDEDLGMQFRMKSGQQALDASASNAGTLFSGKQQKELLKLGQDLGSQEFNNAYNRQYGQFQDAESARQNQYNTEADRTMNYDQFRMNQLQNIAGMGQGATNQLAGSLQGIGQNQLSQDMNLRSSLADINAQRTMAPWMAGSNAVQSAGNTWANTGMRMLGQSNAGGSTPSNKGW